MLEILDAEQVGQRLKLSKQSVYRYVRLGELPAIHIGKRVMFDWDVIVSQLKNGDVSNSVIKKS